MATISQWAERYIKKYGFHLVPIEPRRKFPRVSDWGNDTINNPMHAAAFYESRADWNVGVALGSSGICSLDIDHLEWFKLICEAFNIDFDALISEYPTIHARGYRVMFRVPSGANLPYVKLTWRPESDPTGDKHRDLMRQARIAKQEGNETRELELRELAKQYSVKTVFELRSATDGSQKQDVLPPSVQESGAVYEWHTPPQDDIPEPPTWLLTIWQNFDSFRKQFMAACPWASIEDIYKEESKKPVRPREYSNDGGLVFAANEYARLNNIADELERQGYKRVSKSRYLSPYSSTGLAGVAVFRDSNKCWIHHASDPLCSDATGQPVSSFDLFCLWQHGGDFVKAAKAAAEQLGLRNDRPQYNPPLSDAMPEFIGGGDEYIVPTREISPDSAVFTLDYTTPLTWLSSNNKPLKNIDNLQEILNRLRCTVRYNVMRKEVEIIIPSERFSVDNAGNASLAWLDSMCSMFNYPTDKNIDYLTYLADKNHYSPVQEWILSETWDGNDRFSELVNTIQSTTPDELKRTLIKRWMLSAIAAAFADNGVAAQGILVLQGDQNLGKTSWFEALVPRDVNREHRMLQSGVILKPDDKDSVKQANSSWLTELGEIDGSMRKSEDAQLKAFITRDEDTMRRPYAKRESTYARRTVFFGTVNPREYLRDDTGNRRYWTIECTAINSRHGINMQQVWSQVYAWWLGEEHHWLTQDEVNQLNAINDDHRVLDPIEERLLSSYDWQEERHKWTYKSVTDILLDIGIDRPLKADVTRAGVIIAKMNGNDKKRRGGLRLTLVPPLAVK